MAQNELSKLKTEFLEYLEIEKGRSVKTVENYDRYLTRYLSFAKASSPSGITERGVREFRLHLNRQAGTSGTMKHKTQNYYMISLRAFLKFLRKRDIESLNPEKIELAKIGARDLDLISSDELNRLINGPKGDSLTALRDRAIMELFFLDRPARLRAHRLNRDLDLSRDEFSVRGKGEKVRVVFLSPAAKKTIKAYLDKRGDIDDALFIQMGKASKNAKTAAPHSPLDRAHDKAVRHEGRHYAQSNAARHPPLLRYRPSGERC